MHGMQPDSTITTLHSRCFNSLSGEAWFAFAAEHKLQAPSSSTSCLFMTFYSISTSCSNWGCVQVPGLIVSNWSPISPSGGKQKQVSIPLKMSKKKALHSRMRGAGESSAHLWISHLPHALHQSTRINIFIIRGSASEIKTSRKIGQKSSSDAKHPQQQRQARRDHPRRLMHFAELRTEHRSVRSSAPRCYVTDAQVQRAATHPRFDEPEQRGDAGIAPPVMVPELRLRLSLSAGLHSRRSAAAAGARLRIVQKKKMLPQTSHLFFFIIIII